MQATIKECNSKKIGPRGFAERPSPKAREKWQIRVESTAFNTPMHGRGVTTSRFNIFHASGLNF